MDRLPFISSYKDRHGRLRWRYRRKGLTVALPGQPGDESFQTAYSAALEGRPKAPVIHPSHVMPRSLAAAWRLSTQTLEFRRLRQSSRDQYIERAERFLALRLGDVRWGDAPVADIRRRHVNALLASLADRPHAAYDVLVILRKMLAIALEHEWIMHDPTHRLQYRPETAGHRAWTDDERATFEARWPLGSLPRTVYALALYTGQRRGDLVRITWSDVAGDVLPLAQQKTGRRLRIPVLPQLRDALAAAPRSGERIIPIGADTLTNYWPRWTAEAGLAGVTLHGLRKTLGKILAEEGATTRELMDALGHSSIAHAELYSREAEQERMARAALDKAKGRLRPRLRVVKGEKA